MKDNHPALSYIYVLELQLSQCNIIVCAVPCCLMPIFMPPGCTDCLPVFTRSVTHTLDPRPVRALPISSTEAVGFLQRLHQLNVVLLGS